MGIAIVNGKCVDLNDAVSVRNLMVQKNKNGPPAITTSNGHSANIRHGIHSRSSMEY